jgi:hypothetical protein
MNAYCGITIVQVRSSSQRLIVKNLQNRRTYLGATEWMIIQLFDVFLFPILSYA